MESEDDSDWEYEYHESETETFYVTLDLSSYAAPARNPSKGEKVPRVTEPPPPPTQSSHSADPSIANLDPRLAPPPDEQTSPSHTPVQAEDNEEGPSTMASGQQPQPPQASSDEDNIQILELHSQNPLISYQSQLYSCEWTSTPGTDVLLAANRAERSSGMAIQQETASAALRSFPGVDLVATSRIKLSARPVQAVPHARGPIAVDSTAPPTVPLTATAPPILADSASASTQVAGPASPDPAPVNATTGGATAPIRIPVEESATPQRRNQAAFLSRLMNIKRAKGEADEVTVTVGPYHEIRRRGMPTPSLRGRGRPGGRGRRAGRARALSRASMGTETRGTGHYVVHPSEYNLHVPQEQNQGQGHEGRLLVDPGPADTSMTDPDGDDGGAGDTDMLRQLDHREINDA